MNIQNGLATEEQCKMIDCFLSPRSFIAANHLTIADIYLYWHLHPAMSAFNVKDLSKFPHLCRWFNHIQSEPRLLGTKMKLSQINLKSSTSIPVFPHNVSCL